MAIRDRDIWIDPDGTIRYLEYSDFVLEGLGTKTRRRLSRIEYIDDSKEWVVFDHVSGLPLGSFLSREAAVAFEHQYYRPFIERLRPSGEIEVSLVPEK